MTRPSECPSVRRLAAGIAAACLLCTPAAAQDWARKMFEEKDHDFGVVARGSDTVYRFPVKNLYKEDVVLGGVRSSCGCTTPSLENTELKSFEVGYVVAKFNTRTFTGVHSATLTVDIVKPYSAQVQLRVHGNIRGDVVFEPGGVDFGQIDQGSPSEKTVTVSYAGHSGWSIQDVRSTNDHLEAELVERSRNGGRVIYDLVVRLRDTAPAGVMRTPLVLVTSDAANPRIPLDVVAEVRPELTVSPDTLVFGDVEPGQTVTKRLLVRGKRPFTITGVRCEKPGFEFDAPETADTKQLVTVKFTAEGDARRIKAPITVTTDLGETFTAECTAYAAVAPTERTAAR
ncbi:DUF1573 domain-containing protein [Botrimarina sp.]|uniref:DUF1573 domain-containing protein n=1 Tax=Botrimarina sp. TaxID=2795802 RepID=UPI0032EF232E